MSIEFNMSNAQEVMGQEEGFLWGISTSDESGGCYRRRMEKQPLEIQTSMSHQKLTKGKKRTTRSDDNKHAEEEESPDHEIHIWTERERRKKMRDMFSKLHALLPQLPPKADKSSIVDEAVNSIRSLEQTLHKLQTKKLEKLQYSSLSNTSPTTPFAYVPSSSSSPSTILTPDQPKILSLGTTSIVDDSHFRETFLADHISSSTLNLPYPCNDPIVAFDTWSSPNVVLNICGNEAFFNLCCPKGKYGVFTTISYLLEKYNIEVLFANVSSNVFRSNYIIQAQVNPSFENQLLRDGFGVGDIFKQVAQELLLYFSSL